MRIHERLGVAVAAAALVLLAGSACSSSADSEGRDATSTTSGAAAASSSTGSSSTGSVATSSTANATTSTSVAATSSAPATSSTTGTDDASVEVTDPTEPTTAAPPPPATTTTLEAPTGEMPTAAPTTTAAPTLPTGTDPACIAGAWTMATDALQALTPKLLPSVPAHLLGGSLRLVTTVDGRFTYSGSALLVRLDSAAGYLEGSGDFAQTGRWTATAGTATTTRDTATGGITTWYAVSGEQRALVPRAPTPLSYDLPASGAFRCDNSLLSFTATASDGSSVPMIFTRTS